MTHRVAATVGRRRQAFFDKRKDTVERAGDSFSARWLELISDPDFVRLSHSAREPSFFRIVGRTHSERWHSAFLAWLIDPTSSHLTHSFALTRMLLAAYRSTSPESASGLALEELAFSEISDVRFAPSELAPAERSVNGVGRFDVFATGTCRTSRNQDRRFNLLIELKVDAPVSPAQAAKYAEWIKLAHPHDCNVLVYISLDAVKSRAADPQGLWAHLSFQVLHDTVLVPTSEHPALNPLARTLLGEYIKNLRHPHRGIRMALTNQQRQLVVSLYERHRLAFDEMLEVLVAEGLLGTPEMLLARGAAGRAKGRIAVRVDQQLIEDETVRGLFDQILRLLVERRWIERLPLPWGDTTLRYVVTNSSPAKHPNGRPFFYPIKVAEYTMESHYSRERAMQALAALFAALDIPFESIPVGGRRNETASA
jgi:hypothetical protein